MAPETASSSLLMPFLNTVQGEIAYFRAIMRARPVGINRHFHILAVRQHIKEATGQLIPVQDLWAKLQDLYDLDALESMDISESDESPPTLTIPLPGSAEDAVPPSDIRRVLGHPHFRSEFSLPSAEFDQLIARRRLRDGASSADEGSAAKNAPSKAVKKPVRSQSRNAGLISGGSESSELTEGEGDEDATSAMDVDSEAHSLRGHSRGRGRGRKTTKLIGPRRGTSSANTARAAAAIETKRKKPAAQR